MLVGFYGKVVRLLLAAAHARPRFFTFGIAPHELQLPLLEAVIDNPASSAPA